MTKTKEKRHVGPRSARSKPMSALWVKSGH